MENIPCLRTLLLNLPLGLCEADATERPFLDFVPDQEKAEDSLAHGVTAIFQKTLGWGIKGTEPFEARGKCIVAIAGVLEHYFGECGTEIGPLVAWTENFTSMAMSTHEKCEEDVSKSSLSIKIK